MKIEDITPGLNNNLIDIGDDPSRYGFTAPKGASTQAIVYYDRQGSRVNPGSPEAYFTSPTGGYTYQGLPNEFDYASIIADPNLMDPEYDISNIRTTTPTSERLLAAVPEYSGLKFDPTQKSVYSDLYSLYSGGLDSYLQNVDPSTGTVDTSVGTGGGGGSGPTLPYIDVDSPKNTGVNPFADIDTGVGEFDDLGPVDTTMPPMLSPDMGASMVTSPSDTTVLGGDPNINRIDDYLDVDYSTPVTNVGNPFGYEDPQSLAVQPSGRTNVNLPGTDDYFDMNLLDETQPSAMPQGSPGQLNPYEPENFLADPTINRIQDYDYMPDATLGDVFTTEARADEATTARPDMLGDTGASMDYMSGALDAPYGVNPNTGIPYQTPRTIADQNRVLGQTFETKDVSQLEKFRDNFVETGQDIGNFFTNLTNEGIDVSKTAGTMLFNYLGKAITGVPLLGTAADLISGALPPKDPRQTALEEFYNLDDIGRVAEGELMAGYNPVSGNPLDPNYGLQEAYQERIDTIEKTLADKYPDGDYSDTELDERLAALKEAKAKEKERLDLFSGDIQPDATDLDIATGVLTGDAAVAEDAQDLNLMDVRDEMADIETGDASLAERIAAENRAAAEEAQRIENERAANARENARAEAAREAAAQAEAEARAAARERARQPAPTYTQPSPHRPDGDGGNQGGNTGGGSGGGGYTGGGWCFDPNTFVQMADGSEKKIKEVQLGDNTKGGEVTGVFQFKAADEIHDYKGVTVAGSHYVKEDGKFIMVQDSPISVKVDKIPVVYSLDTTGRRIFIKGIEFADYNGDGIAKGFLHNAGVPLKGFDKEVLRQVQQRLI